MAVSTRHVVHQAPVVGALLRSIAQGALQKMNGESGSLTVPGPVLAETVPPRPRELVRDYVRHVGGDPSAYERVLPPHLFPQWVFPLQTRTLDGIPYPMEKVLNGGCKMTIRKPLPIDEPLTVTAQLERIDDDGRRAIIHQRAITSTPSASDALVCEMQVVVPLSGGGGGGKKKKEKPRVPEQAKELARWNIGPHAGLDFAKLTGDFNPVHWIPPYARAFGFRNTILHGFSTMSRAYEGLVRSKLAGRIDGIEELEVRFTRPLVLPARVGLYVHGEQVFVGDAAGGPAYLSGRYALS